MVGKRIYKPARVKKEWNFENRRSKERTKRERNKKESCPMKKKPGKNKISGLSSTPLLITRYRRPTVAKQEPSKSLRDDPSMMHWACVFIDEEHTRNDMVPMEPYSTRVVSRLFFLCKTFSGGRSEAPRNVVNSLRPQSGDNLCRPSQLLDEDDNFHWLLPPNSWVPPHFDRERRRIDEEILRQSVRPVLGQPKRMIQNCT